MPEQSLDISSISHAVHSFDISKHGYLLATGGYNTGIQIPKVYKYTADGLLQWEKALTPVSNPRLSPYVKINDLGFDSQGHVYISGNFRDSLFGTKANNIDGFLAKLNPNGDLLWIQQIGTPGWDENTTLEIDQNDNIITATRIDGYIYDDITGFSLKYGTGTNGYGLFSGADDVLLTKFNSDGAPLWRHTVGTGATTYARISLDKIGNISLYGNSDIYWSQADSDALKEQPTSIFFDGRAVAGTQATAALLSKNYFSAQVSADGVMLQAFYHPLNAPLHLEANNSLREGYFTATSVSSSDGSQLLAAGKLNTEFITNHLGGEAPSALYLQRIPYLQIDADRKQSEAFSEYVQSVSQTASINDTYSLAARKASELNSNQGYSVLLRNQDNTLEYLYYMKDKSKNSDGASDWENRGSANGQAFAGTIPIAEVMKAIDAKQNEKPEAVAVDATSLNENIPAGSQVATLSSSDPDPDDTFSYALVPGYGSQDNAAFSIIGNELCINASPNFEAQSSYSIRVRTTDQGGLTADNTFILSVNDLPEAPPAPTYSIETVIDNSDVGVSGSGSGVYGLYLIRGLEGRNGSVLAVTDADLETDASIDSSSHTTPALPLLTAAGALFPSINTPIAIRKDGSNLELLYKPTTTTYQTQDFSLSTGKAVGAPTAAVKALQSFEIDYDQDLDGDGITGPALTITETIDSADAGRDADGAGTYGLYRISGISGKSASQLALSQADLEAGRTIAQSELDPLLPLLTAAGRALPTAWKPLAIRQDNNKLELLYRPSSSLAYQTQDFSLATGKATGAPTPLNRSLQSFEVAYDEDLDNDGLIGITLFIQNVLDPADQGRGGDGLGTYGLYRINGVNGLSTPTLAVADADLEESQLLKESDLSTLRPLLTAAGRALPTAWIPLAIRKDDTKLELLYQPSTRLTYQTQDFSLTTGKAIGAPSAPLTSLVSFEAAYDQDLNEDDVIGLNFAAIGETTAQAGTPAKDRLTLNAMDIGYGGGADDTLLVAPDISSNDPITMVGGPGSDTYTAKAGAFLVVYDLGTTKDTKDLLTGLPGTAKEWSLYKVDTNDFLLQHTDNSTAVLLVDPLGKASAGNKLETIRFSSGAAQTMATLTNPRTGILSKEPAISYADLPDRFGYDIAFAYGISQDAGPLSIQSKLRNNLEMAA